jgi:hypothetical protein
LHINQLRSSAIVKGWRALHAGVPSDDDHAIGFMLRIPRGFLGETQAAVPAGSSSARSCTWCWIAGRFASAQRSLGRDR